MNRLSFLLLSAAVAVSASAGITKTAIQNKVAKYSNNKAKVGQLVRKAAPGTVSSPYMVKKATALRTDVPEGYAMVTLTAGDVWEDGSGYQMLLDADANTYGGIIPEQGGMTTGGDVSAETYAEFEYKIPENADGSLSTTNIVMNASVTIMIPAGTYDWCITNPTAGDRMWIASENGNVNGRADDYVFKSGCSYNFTVSLDGTYDRVDVVIDDPYAPVVPVIAVTPASTSATVAWAADANANGWNLRWRPWTDLSGNPHKWTFPYATYAEEGAGWWVHDADGDGNNWGFTFSSDAQDDVCLVSGSYVNGVGACSPDNYIGTPNVPLKGVLKFTVWGRSNSYPEVLQVYAKVGDDMHQLFQDSILTTEDPKEYTADLSEFGGVEGSIVFRNYSTYDQWSVYVDDIFVGDENDIAELAEWTYVNGITDPNYTIEGLTPETKYEVQVMATSATDETEWCDIVEFVTLAEDPVVLRGDIDKNGKVNIDDVTTLIDMLLNGDFPYSIEADCDRSGKVDIDDVTTLIDYLLSGEWSEVEMRYTVVGPRNVFDTDWDLYNGLNYMQRGSDGTYTWSKSGVILDGNFEFKVVGNRNYSLYEWPIGLDNNWVVNVPEQGIYDIMITFNPNAPEDERINCVLTKTHVYTVIGTPGAVFGSEDPYDVGNRMVKGDDGIYRKAYEGCYLTEWTDVKFKVIQDCNMEISWPKTEEGYWYTGIPATGVYHFYITFNPETGEVNCEVKKEDLPE
ncbi:MAG: DUF2436 domain-containing protein [Muribaculaceae bacterium]|nr:DUF2436 domain-containing protein [Muribaculaceae bacterium]